MEQSTCNMMWNLLAPSPEYNNRWDAFRDYWYRQTLARQRQLYWYFREEKKAGRSINPNPLFAIQQLQPATYQLERKTRHQSNDENRKDGHREV